MIFFPPSLRIEVGVPFYTDTHKSPRACDSIVARSNEINSSVYICMYTCVYARARSGVFVCVNDTLWCAPVGLRQSYSLGARSFQFLRINCFTEERANGTLHSINFFFFCVREKERMDFYGGLRSLVRFS